MHKLIRVTTASMSFKFLIKGQARFLNQFFNVIAVTGDCDYSNEIKEIEGVDCNVIKMKRNISLIKDLIFVFKLYIFFRNEKPQIVHSITPKAGLLSMFAAYFAGVPIRVHTYTGLIFPSKSKIKRQILIIAEKLLCYFATNIYSDGNGVKNDLINCKPVIENIYDKLKLIELAKGINIPTPETYHLNTINSDALKSIKYPVITKGRNGLTFYKKTKKKALIAEDKDSLMNQLHSLEQLMPIDMAFTQGIIQSNGNNKTISFTSFCVDGQIKTFWMGVKLREHPVKFGTATFVKSTYVHEIREHSIKLIQELNYTGICEIEYLLDPADNQYKLIEVNPRTWLWVGLARSCGINYAKIAYDFVNDIPITYPQEYSTEKYWYNPITDYVYGLKSIMQKEITFRSFLHSLIKKKQSALFFKLDFKPGVFYILNIFKFYRNR